MAREMKNSGIEWIGEIPAEWKLQKGKFSFRQRSERGNTVELQLLSPTQRYGVIPQSLYEELSGMKAVKLEQNVDLSEFRSIYYGDFCISLRSFQGGFEYSKYNGVVSPAYQVFYSISDEIYNGYYRFLFKEQGFVAYMTSFTKTFRDGKSIAYSDFANSLIPIPSFSEQKRIAAHLDTVCARIDDVIAKTKATIEEYKKLKQSVITEAVTKGIRPDRKMKNSGVEWMGEIPIDWKLQKGKFSFMQRNERGNTVELQLLSPTQRYGVIPQSVYEELSGMKAVKLDLNADLSEFKSIYDGDFCISLRSFQGGFEYSKYNGVVSPAYQVFFSISRDIFNDYYRYLFKEQGFIAYMTSFTKTFRDGKNIAYADFANALIPIPTIGEQKEISTYLDTRTAEIDTLISKKEQIVTELESYKKSIIFEYVTGKKAVTIDS